MPFNMTTDLQSYKEEYIQALHKIANEKNEKKFPKWKRDHVIAKRVKLQTNFDKNKGTNGWKKEDKDKWDALQVEFDSMENLGNFMEEGLAVLAAQTTFENVYNTYLVYKQTIENL